MNKQIDTSQITNCETVLRFDNNEFKSMENFFGDIRDQIKTEFTKLIAEGGTIEIQTVITGTYIDCYNGHLEQPIRLESYVGELSAVDLVDLDFWMNFYSVHILLKLFNFLESKNDAEFGGIKTLEVKVRRGWLEDMCTRFLAMQSSGK